MGRAEINALRPGSFLADISRGGVTDTAALTEALASGRVRGAALDVFEQEPLPAESPLWDVPNLVISPHNAVGMENYGHHAFMRFIENVRRHLKGEPLLGVVDPRLGY
jgi:D-2-hydroxyacid dehydrogenase (NADP+)